MLDNLKALLGLPEEDISQDKKLQLILTAAKSRLKLFNRIGSEGLSSHSVEGESLSWSENDFAGYMDDIRSYLDSQKEITKGKVRFL